MQVLGIHPRYEAVPSRWSHLGTETAGKEQKNDSFSKSNLVNHISGLRH